MIFPDSPSDKSSWLWAEASEQLPDRMPDGSPWPKISIVTPSYNQAQYLEETIRSVLLQNYPNLEYIIMDGGSTDGSVEIIKKYSKYLTYWESETDRGQSHAINKGFQRSTGEIMAWINSDDYYAENAFKIVAEKLGSNKKAMLIGSSIQIENDEKPLRVLDDRKPAWDAMVYDSRTFPQPSVFWTRALWDKAGPLDDSLYFLMDYDLWLKMRHETEQAIFVDNVLSYVNLHQDQKWKRAERSGTLDLFTKERASVSIRAAKMRSESPIFWLGKLWAYRFTLACKNKNWYLLKGSKYHWEASRQVFRINRKIVE